MKYWQLALAAGLLGVGSLAQAGLIPYTSNGAALVFDDDYGTDGLTWTGDANLFKTQYDADNTVVDQIIAAAPTVTDSNGPRNILASDFNTGTGQMNWWGAMAWAKWLGIIGYGGADNWRLWSALDSDGTGPCSGFNCTDSELGHLFYGEGGLSAFDAINDSAALTAVFTNMQDFSYWSGTEYAPVPVRAWYFRTDVGVQGVDGKVVQYSGWAVRPGQVAAAPLPGTAVLMALGLFGLGARNWVRRSTLAIR